MPDLAWDAGIHLDGEAWRSSAACRGMDTADWFPERGGRPAPLDHAREVCASCPVRVDCLDYATAQVPQPTGVWGGLSERERRNLRRRRLRLVQD